MVSQLIIFWALALIGTAVACWYVVRPLMRPVPVDDAVGQEKSLQVFKDQLTEIERDQERGLLSADQAKSAEIEVKRRILGLDLSGQAQAQTSPKVLSLALPIVFLLATVGLYVLLGAGGMPGIGYDQRIAMAQSPESQDWPARVRVLETRLNDQSMSLADRSMAGREAARLYLGTEQVIKGLETMRDTTKVDPNNADLFAEYGEMLFTVGQAREVLPDAARQAIGRSLQLDPLNPRGLFMGGMIAAYDGNGTMAFQLWNTLRNRVSDDQPLAKVLDERLEEAQAMMAQSEAEGSGPAMSTPGTIPMDRGPSAADIQVAQEMTAEDRMAMIEGMVESLAERLEDEPEDTQGWLRLTNAYIVLGRKDEATQALSRLPADNPNRATLEARIQALN